MSNNQQLENLVGIAIRLGQHKPTAPPGDLARDLGKIRKLAHSLYLRRAEPYPSDTHQEITKHLEGKVRGLAYMLGLSCQIVPGDYPVKLIINGTEHWVY